MLESGLVLAKQVLSQLGYTPAHFSFYFNHLRTPPQLFLCPVVKT